MASFAETLENMQTGWKKLDLNQKMVIGMTVILFVVVLGSLVYWISRPSYSVLFSNLSPGDASTIVAKLQEKKIPYNLIGMQTIEVSSDKVYQTRIELAGEGLPQGGTVGFEIFDQSNFGLSEFTQKINYRRALEGELARTIQEINEIEGARVHIVLPERSLYQEKEAPATSSIVVKSRAGARLSEGQVQGITNLVARSVEGLKPENITIVDTNGNVLSDSASDSVYASQGGYTKVQIGLKETYESNLEKKIQSMLGKVLGNENNAVVRVSADLDFTQKEIKRNIVEQSSNPVVVSEQVDKEKYEGAGSLPSGIAGVSSQATGSAGETTGQTTYPQVGQGANNSSYTKTNKTTNYDSTKISEHEIKAPGDVKKLSVAVVVNNNGTKPILNDTIENLVSAAAGIDKNRGDVLTVSSIPFDTKWVKQEEQAIAEAQKKETYASYGKYAVAAILLVVALLFLFKIASSIKPAARLPQEFVAARRGSSGSGFSKPAVTGLGSTGLRSNMDLLDGELDDISISDLSPEERRELAIKQKKSQLTREEIQGLARERPGDVAQLLRIWLNT